MGEGYMPEKVLMIGYFDSEAFRPLTIGGEDGERELVVFGGKARAGAVLEGLDHNPEMVGLAVPMHRLHARKISLLGAMDLARAVECDYVGIDVNFENPHFRIPVCFNCR